jgi:hypothetical protein
MVLGHDITEIVPGRFKGPAFKRGHVIRPEDVDRVGYMKTMRRAGLRPPPQARVLPLACHAKAK